MLFLTEYVPTVFDNYNAMYEFESQNIFLGLWDTAGQSDFDKVRPISYKQADVYLLFFSVINPTSLENIRERWVDEVIQHSPTAPYFLVGTQIDERENETVIHSLAEQGKTPITSMMGAFVAKQIGAKGYFEISAKEMRFGNLFEEVIRHVFNVARGMKKKKSMCWSIQCRTKLKIKNTVKCKGCANHYCIDCMEYWKNGDKWCPNCAVVNKRKLDDEDAYEEIVKKPRKSPQERLKEKEEKFRRKLQKQLDKNPDLDVNKFIEDNVDKSSGSDEPIKKKKKT